MNIANAKGIAKAFNTTGAENIHLTQNGSIDTFIAGQEDAKATAKELAIEIGFNAVDVGGIDNAHALEEMAKIWVVICRRTGKFEAYFKVKGL
jgi:predicted dinucleotide-binding enzyme